MNATLKISLKRKVSPVVFARFMEFLSGVISEIQFHSALGDSSSVKNTASCRMVDRDFSCLMGTLIVKKAGDARRRTITFAVDNINVKIFEATYCRNIKRAVKETLEMLGYDMG